MGNKVTWFEVAGKDGDKLREFYGKSFGWQFNQPPGMNYGMVDPSDAGIGGGIAGDSEDGGHLTFYVEVDDVQAALDKVEGLGGKKVMGPDQVPGGPEIAMFTDPEGHMVGLVKPQPM
ncbi:MAG: VOC family protein [Dehalococcoidia bacterium]